MRPLRPMLRHSQTNLTLIKAHLNNLGYAVTVEKLRSDVFGIPQRRCRLYFFGIRKSEYLSEPPEAVLAKIPFRLAIFHKQAPPVAHGLCVSARFQNQVTLTVCRLRL